MLLTDAQIRAHLRIDEAESVSVYANAAELAAIEYLNRKVYADQAALDASNDTTGIVVNDAIKNAILLLAGHLFANRESVTVGGSAIELPLSAHYLLQPYRIGIGV